MINSNNILLYDNGKKKKHRRMKSLIKRIKKSIKKSMKKNSKRRNSRKIMKKSRRSRSRGKNQKDGFFGFFNKKEEPKKEVTKEDLEKKKEQFHKDIEQINNIQNYIKLSNNLNVIGTPNYQEIMKMKEKLENKYLK